MATEYREIAIGFLRQRDGDKCWLCQGIMLEGDESLDHVLTVKAGGTHHPSNIRLAHIWCNKRRKHNAIH